MIKEEEGLYKLRNHYLVTSSAEGKYKLFTENKIFTSNNKLGKVPDTEIVIRCVPSCDDFVGQTKAATSSLTTYFLARGLPLWPS